MFLASKAAAAGTVALGLAGYLLGEEVSDPARTIPRAIGITIGGAVLLYGAVAAVAVGALGAEPLGEMAAPCGWRPCRSPFRGSRWWSPPGA